MATTLNIDSLPEYIEQHRDELFVKSAVGAKTLDYVELMLNVKHKDALNYLDSEVEFQTARCGWNPNGSDTFSQRYIEVKPVEVEKEWCYLDFKEKYMNYQLRFEAGRETLPFEEKLTESNMNAISSALENLIWNGNQPLGISGFLADVDEATEDTSKAIEYAEGATATQAIDGVVAALDSRMLKKGVNIFVSPTMFRNYIQESNSTCCANRPVIDAASESITYFGDSRITIIPVEGLEDANALVAATKDALVYGTDIEGSESVYRLWFDEKEQKFMFRVLFNAGTAVKFPDEVVISREAQ